MVLIIFVKNYIVYRHGILVVVWCNKFLKHEQFWLFHSELFLGWGRVHYFSFFGCLSPLCFLLIEFHCSFFHFFIKYYQIMFIIIVFWLGSDRPSELLFLSCPLCFFPHSRFTSYLLRLFFVLFRFCCSHARVFGKTHVYEFRISYSHTEW